MKVFARQLRLELKLQLRNRLGLAYGFLFPAIFLLAFWTLYRHEPIPLVRHLGALLTVTVLAGACFGFPLALVNERERGLWRRYRLLPVTTIRLLSTALIGRYLLLCMAGMLQVGLAVALGMPVPAHPLELWVAFTFVSFAFLGVGLLVAMVADTVTAAQALGQSIFLPMLILGGVAVRLETMPGWVQHLSAFFPGRYAVRLIDRGLAGAMIPTGWFSVASLVLMGGAAFLAGVRLFRTETRHRLPLGRQLRWIGVALGGWMLVGVGAEVGGYISPERERRADARADSPAFVRQERTEAAPAAADRPVVQRESPSGPDTLLSPAAEPRNATPETASVAETSSTPLPLRAMADGPGEANGRDGDGGGEREGDEDTRAATATPPPDPVPSTEEAPADPADAPWQAVTLADIERDLVFDRLPPDAGVVAPIARASDRDDPFVADRLDCIARMLPDWEPAAVVDPVQRVRNLLYVAAVPDVLQMQDIESVVPLVVFERLEQEVPADDLLGILYWIALHPYEGDLSATERLLGACLDVGAPADVELLQARTGVYAAKLLGRLTGNITPR